MLVLAASSDKLAATAKTSAVTVAMFACIAGSTKLQGNITALTTVPSVIVTFASISLIATRLGQRKAMILGLLCNLIAMKFYPLTKEKMAEIQDKVAAIKAAAAAEEA